jgi:hypothetical protein
VKHFILIINLFVALFLTGCTISDEEITKTTIELTEQEFESKTKKPNKESALFSYYLPEEFSVKETNKFNVLLEKGNQDYILFVNENEEKNSKVSYETLAEEFNKPFISETFSDNDRFGYLFVNKLEKNRYEVTVGIGGTKLTTVAKSTNVSDSAKNMMDIAASIE